MNRFVPRLIWLILWTLSWLPGFILRFLSYLINVVIFIIFRYREEVVKSNLRHSLPELSILEQNKTEQRFYQHFSELFLEMVLFIRLKPHRQSRRIRFSNPEIIARAFGQKQNIIILAGHYGNWEWNLLPILESGYRVFAVYKPQSSKLAGQLMKYIRQKPGIILVPMKETFRVISRELQENNSPFTLLLISDQIPARVDIRFWTPFLSQDTAFFTGGEKLARRFGFPVYYTDQVKRRFGCYEANITLVYDGLSPSKDGEITRTFTKLLEASIRREPYLWLWTHKRWKYRREELPLRI
jgi:Kdo2-lipid IVA lauroyltransferase/acyltransferase